MPEGSSDDTVSHHSYPSFNESDPDKILADAFNGKVIRFPDFSQCVVSFSSPQGA